MGYYGSNRRRGFRRYYGRTRRMPSQTSWWPGSAATIGTFSAANREYQGIICSINDIDVLSAGQLDWGRRSQPIIERILMTIAIQVTNAAIKKLLRVIFGLRLQELDAAGALPVSFTTLAFNTVQARREDWLYTEELDVLTGGDALATYVPSNSPLHLDFRPRRKFEQNFALVFQARWGDIDDAGPDANMKIAYTPKILLKRYM